MASRTATLLGIAAAASGAALLAWAGLGRPRPVPTSSGLAWVRRMRDGEGRLMRVLQTGHVLQSATYLSPDERMVAPFAYQREFMRAFDLVPDASDVLVVGGGGFGFPKMVAAARPGCHLVVAELEPSVVEAARRWFFLDEARALMERAGGRMDVVCDDGRRVLDGCAPGSLDVVVLDAFVGDEPVASLATAEAAASARGALRGAGVLLANVVSRDDGCDLGFLRDLVASLRTAFAEVLVVPASDEDLGGEDNYLVVAGAPGLRADGAVAYDEAFLGTVRHDADARRA